ncbi:unnamed protein product [Amoebophrya sp. A120]|nr:unnamed protein product [Amoebophrya sp. A120]|eukprot:GSA120T00008478001.1
MSYVCEKASLTTNKGEQLLQDIDLKCERGEVTAILGPSGSGKTVLLNLLTFNTGKKTTNTAKSVTVDGKGVATLQQWMEHCIYVPNITDLQFPTLTCKQVLTYAARWQSPELIEERVNDVLQLLGLESCQDTQVAGAFGLAKGLSGGQKRRLALGVGLLRQADVLFIDDVTSGLDSAAAFNIMKCLQKIAVERNVSVICTLQQPAEDIWDLCDRILLLSDGKSAFFGYRGHCLDYFKETCGLKKPNQQNAADFVLNAINADFVALDEVERVLRLWEENKENQAVKTRSGSKDKTVGLITGLQQPGTGANATSPDDGENTTVVFKSQKTMQQQFQNCRKSTNFEKLKVTFARDLRVTMTDPVLYWARAIMNFVMSFFLVALWWEGIEYDNEFAMNYPVQKDRTRIVIMHYKSFALRKSALQISFLMLKLRKFVMHLYESDTFAIHMNRMWPMAMAMSNITLESIICVYFFNKAHQTWKVEIRSQGFYPSYCVVVSNFLLSIPCLGFTVFMAMFPGNMYGLGNYEIEGGFEAFTVMLLMAIVFDGFGKLCSLTDNMLVGFLGYIQFWFASFLFCGFMIEFDLVVWPLRALTYTSPHRHAIPAVLYADFARHTEWKNAAPCAAGMLESVATQANCIFQDGFTGAAGARTAVGAGFACAYQEYQCWGYTGIQVLRTMHKVYPVVDYEDPVFERSMILLGFGLLWNLCYGMGLIYKMIGDVPKIGDSALQPTSGANGVVPKNKKRLSYHQHDNDLQNDKAGDVTATGTTSTSTELKYKVQDNTAEDNSNPGNTSSSDSNPIIPLLKIDNINVVTKEIKPGFLTNKQGKPAKQLVIDVSLEANRGEVYAILGPSGAGKTTFLDAITCNAAKNLNTFGTVAINGEKVENLQDLIAHRCVYIPQHNEYFATLTPKEVLEYSADFANVDRSKVDKVIRKLGLQSCQNTKIGGKFGTVGLSEGQKKRLSVAQALIKEPLILFLDEPTTGLDAASAYYTMRYIRKIAHEDNMLIICTIHQPSFDVWQMFDKVQLLANGFTAYAGRKSFVETYFSKCCGSKDNVGAHALPFGRNPAEVLLDKINADFSPKEVVDDIIESWKIWNTKKMNTTMLQNNNLVGTTTDDVVKPSSLELQQKQHSGSGAGDSSTGNSGTGTSGKDGMNNQDEQNSSSSGANNANAFPENQGHVFNVPAIEGSHNAAPAGFVLGGGSSGTSIAKVYPMEMEVAFNVEGNHNLETDSDKAGTTTTSTSIQKMTTIQTSSSFVAVTKRAFHVAFTDYSVYLGRIPLYWVSCMFFCLVYVEVREMKQPNVLFRMWLIMWCICSQCVFGCVSVIFYGNEYQLVRDEIRNGFYKARDYHLALVLVSIPMVFLLAFATISGNAYGVGNFDWEDGDYGMFLINCFVNHLVFEAFAQASSVQFDNIIIGMLNYVGYWFNAFLFMGMMLDLDNTLIVFQWMSWAMPFKYSYNTAVYLEYEGRTLPGADRCPMITSSLTPPSNTVNGYLLAQQSAGSNQGGCIWKPDDVVSVNGVPTTTTDLGYTCGLPGSYKHICYGFTGNEAMDTIHRMGYSATKDEDFMLRNFIGLLVLLVLNKLTHVMFFNQKVHYSSKLAAAGGDLEKETGLKEASGKSSPAVEVSAAIGDKMM